MLKKPMRSLTAAMFLMCSAGLVQAQTPVPPPDDQAKTTTTDPYRAVDRDFDWGWLGLIGLFGLAGLAGRSRDVITTRRATDCPERATLRCWAARAGPACHSVVKLGHTDFGDARPPQILARGPC